MVIHESLPLFFLLNVPKSVFDETHFLLQSSIKIQSIRLFANPDSIFLCVCRPTLKPVSFHTMFNIFQVSNKHLLALRILL